MTTPAAAAALARMPNPWANQPGGPSAAARLGYEQCRSDILAHDFTPAERAALAAAILTPEVLAEALGSAYTDEAAFYGTTDAEYATALLAALTARGEA